MGPLGVSTVHYIQKCIAHQGKVEVGVATAALVLVILLALALQLQSFKLLDARGRDFLSQGNLTRLDAPDLWPDSREIISYSKNHLSMLIQYIKLVGTQ